MIEGGLPKPCDDCPALRKENSFTVEAGETIIYETNEGYRICSVYSDGDSASFSEIDINNSPVAISIEDCSGPIRTEAQQTRKGLAGLFGLKKTVTTIWCPGINKTKVIEE
jgi:hypothetical protein